MRYLLLLALFVTTVTSIACNATHHCPEDTPCCSQYGVCGVGSYCLGSCDPRFSYNINACMPSPVCKNVSTTFTSTDQFTSVEKYLGNASSTDWIYEGHILEYDDSIVMAMPKDSGGTVVSSTRFIWYGKMEVKIKTSHLAGVVTAFILFSNVQDEIDFENVGVDLYKFQTNYYFQGQLNYNHSQNITTDDSTFDNYHTLGVDWTEDHIQWSVNGKVGRTLKREDTWNETTQEYKFPQTPSRLQISLWPAGASNEIGTVNWAGGKIHWDAPDLTDPGYYYAFLQEASISCYDPPKGTNISGNNAYVYNSVKGNQSNVRITNDKTYLGSFDATGLKPDNANKKNSTKASASQSGSVPTGMGSGGHGNNDDDDNNNNNNDNDSSNDAETTSTTYTAAGFQQFASSSESTTGANAKSKNLANLVVDTSNILTLGALAASLVVSFMII